MCFSLYTVGRMELAQVTLVKEEKKSSTLLSAVEREALNLSRVSIICGV